MPSPGGFPGNCRVPRSHALRKEASTMGTRWSGLAVLLTLLGGLLVAGAAEAQEELFVANFAANSVTVYGRTARGNIAPLRTLSGAATGLSGPAGLALDLTNNELVVANNRNNSSSVHTSKARSPTT